MTIRFYNAQILTMESESLISGELWTDGDKISYVGPAKDTSSVTFDREIDCKGNLLMPGLKNAHTHSAMTFSRSLADNYCLNDWLFKAIFPREKKLTPEHIYWFTKLAYAEYIAGGTTACFDMYPKRIESARAAVETGFRYVSVDDANDFGGMDLIEENYHKFNSYDPLVSYILGFHAEYTTCEENLRLVSDLAHKYKAPVYAHISETKPEVEGCIERYGMSPVKLFDKLGIYDYGGGGFHCVWFDDEDMEIYKKRGLFAVINGSSNLKLASGVAKVYKFIDKGINIALGTDGAGSNNSLNMFREMFLASTLSNLEVEGGAFVSPFEVLKAATAGGARAMGLNDCDVLAIGKQADICMLDMSHPTMNPVNNTVSNIVYSGHPGLVKMTMVAGRILYEDGEYKTIDLDEVISQSNKLLKELA